MLIKRTDPETHAPQILFQYDHTPSVTSSSAGASAPRAIQRLKTPSNAKSQRNSTATCTPPKDYTLRLLAADLRTPPVLSPTFGALTEYTFHFYLMTNLRHPLTLNPDDRWINLDEALATDGIQTVSRTCCNC